MQTVQFAHKFCNNFWQPLTNSVSTHFSFGFFQYFSLIVLLFLSEFLLGSLVFVFRGGIGRTVQNELKYGIEKHYNASDRGGLATPSVASIWDNLQTTVKRSTFRRFFFLANTRFTRIHFRFIY